MKNKKKRKKAPIIIGIIVIIIVAIRLVSCAFTPAQMAVVTTTTAIRGDLQDSVNYGLEKYGMPKRTLEEIRCFVGNGVGKLIERAVPKETTKDEEAKVFDAFKE